jgi:hydroxylaminobenzene mutase
MDQSGRRLFWHGILLFLLGLVTGLFVQNFDNPRMGLAAHLEGLMNGTFLLALGAAWSHVRLSPRTSRIAFVSALFGTYGNWFTTTLAAIFGTASMTPLASGSYQGRPWQEILVSAGFVSVSLAMLVAAGIVLYGFRRNAAVRSDAAA